MPGAVISLDFLLYDNRTLSAQWGRDWGLKAATGTLAERGDLQSTFARYCGATSGERGQLRGFDAAIGGVRDERGNGYLLCATLEISDFFGRPSWAVIGLWCPSRLTLDTVLAEGDPITSARTLVARESLPGTIEVHSANKTTGSSRKRKKGSGPSVHRFDTATTVRDVTSLLLGAAGRTGPLPNILGITASARFDALWEAGFDLVFCHPADERTQRALIHVERPPELEEEAPRIASASWREDPSEAQDPRTIKFASSGPLVRFPESKAVHQRSWLSRMSWQDGLIAFSVVVVVVGGLWLTVLSKSQDSPDEIRELVRSTGETSAVEASEPGGEAPPTRSTDRKLSAVKVRLREWRELSEEGLFQSDGYLAAEGIDVLPEFVPERQQVRAAYATMRGIRERMVGRQGNYVAYYFDEAGRNADSSTKLEKIAEILREGPLGQEECAVIRSAFGFEFENEQSAVRLWCEAARRLWMTAAALEKGLGGR